jgi:hypothetical protein
MTSTEDLYDVIYIFLDDDTRNLISAAWPSAEFEDTYDEIHEDRTVVTLNASRDEWYRFLIKHELPNLSLLFQFEILDNPSRIKKILDEGQD